MNKQDNKGLVTQVQNTPATRAADERPKTVADKLAILMQTPAMQKQLVAALPAGFSAPRLMRTVLTEVRKNPDLLNCTLDSLVMASITAAQLGLEPGPLGHCYLVGFNQNIAPKGQTAKWEKRAQCIIGVRGMLDLARRSGEIEEIGAEIIRKNDTFVFRKGFNAQCDLEFPLDRPRGDIVAVFAYAKTKDGGRYAELMTIEQVNHVRGKSKNAERGPWVDDWEEMARKTVLKRLCKYLPLSLEAAERIAEDQDREFADAGIEGIDLGTVEVVEMNMPQQETAKSGLDASQSREEGLSGGYDPFAPRNGQLEEVGELAGAPLA